MISMNFRNLLLVSLCAFGLTGVANAQTEKKTVSEERMQAVYNEIKTPYKYGLVMVPPDNSEKMDCPSVFRKGNKWYMTYLIYGGRGYETWLAESKNLLDWKVKGRIMSFSDTTDWDVNQKAGYVALQNPKWGGNYKWKSYKGKHWMSYFGGNSKGYEAGVLSIGMAYTKKDPTKVHEWDRLDKPVLTPHDKDVRWWENSTMYKNSIVYDKSKTTGAPFVMYYNARGDSLKPHRGSERIGMALSDDMVNWRRFQKDPVLGKFNKGITGDAVVQKMGDMWVMFYFGAFWQGTKGAFNRFACSYDLVNWTDWKGANLIEPSTPYDELFAHKSFVVKHKGVVYHFYCAVNKKDQRGIAVATSIDKGTSKLNFVQPPTK